MPEATILIVEDEILFAKNLQNTLISQGYQAPFICDNGKDAIVKAEEINPTLVLMDIMLKGKMDGIDAAEYLYFRLNIPVIFITAFADEKTLNRSRIAEPYGYLLKPISERELQTTIEMAIQKHRLENKLKEKEEWLSFILGNIEDAVFVTNNKLEINYINQAAESLTGLTQKETIGLPIKDILILQEMDKIINLDKILNNVKNNNKKFEIMSEFSLIDKEHNKIPVNGSISPLWDDRNLFMGILIVIRDITSQKKIENEVLKLEKLESLSLLAGGIAHDFNNMLTAVIGNLSLCRLNNIKKDELNSYLEESEKACLRAKELTQQLMTYAKGGTLNLKTHDIRNVIQSIVSFIIHGSNIKPVYEFTDDLKLVNIDLSQIEQVIQNLVINAREAMADGGILTIIAENIIINDESLIKSPVENIPLKNGNYVKIIFKDNGNGIADKNIKKIFDPYFTTKPNGTGLGLPTAFSLLKKHNGAISVESEIGKGTTFIIYLPASKESN